MNEKAKKAMNLAWREWHADVPDDLVPAANPSFVRGFFACYEWLYPVLQESDSESDELANRLRDEVN